MGQHIQFEPSSPASNAWLSDLLRGTLRHLEEDPQISSDDAVVRHIKTSIVQALAKLQPKQQAA